MLFCRSVTVLPLTLFGHLATCHSFSQWPAQQPRGSQSAQSRNPLSHFHHKPPLNGGDWARQKSPGKPCIRRTRDSKRGAIFSHAMWRRPRRERTHTQNGCCRPYLAGQDVSEGRECVIQSLVINGLVQILDKDVANAALSEGRVTLRPHDTKRSAFNHVEVHRVEGSLSYNTTWAFCHKIPLGIECLTKNIEQCRLYNIKRQFNEGRDRFHVDTRSKWSHMATRCSC